MDEVVSVGGVYPQEEEGFHASSYASSGECNSNLGRQCPDLCGLVGDDEGLLGRLIMMPTVTDGYYDNEFAGVDQTATNDGWICASGTSSAAPQVAGVAALLLQSDPTMGPEAVKTILQDTATDVVLGASASGEAAGSGVDLATGHGLVNAAAAVGPEEPCTVSMQACLAHRELGCLKWEGIACRAALITGCAFGVVTLPGGCGPRSLIADWRWWERNQPSAFVKPVVRQRMRRLVERPTGGEHVRRLRATSKRRQVGSRVRIREVRQRLPRNTP
jgi:hypothetical protein